MKVESILNPARDWIGAHAIPDFAANHITADGVLLFLASAFILAYIILGAYALYVGLKNGKVAKERSEAQEELQNKSAELQSATEEVSNLRFQLEANGLL